MQKKERVLLPQASPAISFVPWLRASEVVFCEYPRLRVTTRLRRSLSRPQPCSRGAHSPRRVKHSCCSGGRGWLMPTWLREHVPNPCPVSLGRNTPKPVGSGDFRRQRLLAQPGALHPTAWTPLLGPESSSPSGLQLSLVLSPPTSKSPLSCCFPCSRAAPAGEWLQPVLRTGGGLVPQ